MKKHLLLLIALIQCGIHGDTRSNWKRRSDWKHNGVYIVNNSNGNLTILWNNHKQILPKAQMKCTSMTLIPAPIGTKIKITYSDTIDDHSTLHTCRGGAHTDFTVEDRIMLYEITGGYGAGMGPFNRPGSGPHCTVKVHRRLNAARAKQKYPRLR